MLERLFKREVTMEDNRQTTLLRNAQIRAKLANYKYQQQPAKNVASTQENSKKRKFEE